MPVIRRGDNDSIERFLLFDQLTVVGIGLNVPGLSSMTILGTSDLVGINVTKRHYIVSKL